MKLTTLIFIAAGLALVWWSLTELEIIGPNQSLGRDSSGNRVPGGYTSPGTH